MKKMNEMKKTTKVILLMIITAMALFSLAACGEADKDTTANSGAVATCTVIINCEKALAQSDNLSVELPNDGIILSIDEYEFHEGDTAFDVFRNAMEENDILFEYSDNMGGGKMVDGINNLYNGDCGDLSGWMFIINDEMSMENSDSVTVKAGDKLVFAYSCDCGEDLGFTY